jgi:dihydroneopterin aldolase
MSSTALQDAGRGRRSHEATGTRLRTDPRIVIRRLALTARIGVHDWEQVAPQPLVLDLEYGLPGTEAQHSDELKDTIDYAAVVARLRGIALERPHRLVEAMACTMADCLLADFGMPWLVLRLSKLAPFPGAEVGVVIEREARP